MSDDLGGDALAHLALGLGIDWQREIGMRLDVDEAGRDREARRVDDVRSVAGQIFSERGDAAVRDREIAHDAGSAGAVDQESVMDQDVVGHG